MLIEKHQCLSDVSYSKKYIMRWVRAQGSCEQQEEDNSSFAPMNNEVESTVTAKMVHAGDWVV